MSSDGIKWTEITSACTSQFSPRFNFQIINVHDIKLYLVGGINSNLEMLNDVWKSTDGLNWTLVTPGAEFSPRIHFTLN